MNVAELASAASDAVTEERQPARRRWLWLLAISLLVAAGAGGWMMWQQRFQDPLAGVELVEVKSAPIEDAVSALGKLQPRDYVDVGVQVSGQLKHVAVQVGDHVEAGALLAEIDPRLQAAKLELDSAQLAQLEAEREVQKLQLALSTSQFERQSRMLEDHTTRTDVFERTRSEMQIASAKLVAMDAQIRQIRSTTKADEAQLSFTRIFAPIAGTVVSIEARPGQTLIASQQAPVLLRIADLSSMTVWAQVSEADITRLRAGMALYFTTLGQPGRKWNGSLRQLLPAPPKLTAAAPGVGVSQVTSNVVLYTALFDVDNRHGELRPEMSAQIFFVAAHADDALVIPTRAIDGELAEGANEATVTVATADGQLEPRHVKLGIRNRFDVQVLDGLAAGERVVNHEAGDDAGEGGK